MRNLPEATLPGVKFEDAELLGVPWIVVVGRGWADGTVELRNRFTGEKTEVPVDGVVAEVGGAPGEPACEGRLQARVWSWF